jgi:hypothetical protein
VVKSLQAGIFLRVPPLFKSAPITGRSFFLLVSCRPAKPEFGQHASTLGISVGAGAWPAPIEKLYAARTTAVDRGTCQGLDQRQWILRKAVHFVAFIKSLHGFRPAADATGMAGKQEAAVRIKEAVIGAYSAETFRAFIHIGPHKSFESRSMNAHKAASAIRTGRHRLELSPWALPVCPPP